MSPAGRNSRGIDHKGLQAHSPCKEIGKRKLIFLVKKLWSVFVFDKKAPRDLFPDFFWAFDPCGLFLANSCQAALSPF